MRRQSTSWQPSAEVSRQIDGTAYDNVLTLLGHLGDISAVAAIADQLSGGVVGSPVYIVSDTFPTTASIGDLTVNVLDGGIYQWSIVPPATTPSWVLVAQSAGTASGGTATATVTQVSGLPATFTANGIVYNTVDGIYYAFVGGVWQAMIAPTLQSTTVGIEVVSVLPTTALFEGRVVFDTSTNKLMKYTTGAWLEVVQPTGAAASVADGTLTVAKFAAGLIIPEIVDTLPTTGNFAGRLAYLTTDGQLYRYNGTAWTNKVPTTALTGTITSTQIGPNSVTTGALAVGVVTADTIAANAITAGKIAVNAVTAGTIVAGAIGANEIAANAITSTKIAAGAVTANSIAALSIDASKIVAGSIDASKIAANSITAGMIQAGSIDASKLQANSVTATQIAAGSITADKVSSASITADKIQSTSIPLSKLTPSSSVFNGVTFSLGAGSTLAGYSAGGVFTAATPDKGGLIAANSAGIGFAAGTLSASSEAAIFVNATDSAYTAFRTRASLAYGSVAGEFVNNTSGKWIQLATASYAFLTGAGASGSFTGAHDGLVLKTSAQPDVGDIVGDTSVYAKPNVYDTICVNSLTSKPNMKNVVGVVAGYADKTHVPAALLLDVSSPTVKSLIINPIYTDIGLYNQVIINALGEGLINVCGENGNIEAGDLISSSSITGKGMKQSDDLVHNYTAAKSREAVTFSSPTEVKQIACIYMCG